MGLSLVTAPTGEHLTLVEARDHLKVETSEDDGLIAGYILAAREAAENYTRRKFYTQTWDFTIDGTWPTEKVNGYARPRIILPLPPVQSVSSITYYDTSGVQQTLAADQYRVSLKEYAGRIEPAYGVTWPSVRDMMETITVRMVVGYTALPEAIRQALKLTIGHYYANRESVVIGTISTELPQSAQLLLDQYRSYS